VSRDADWQGLPLNDPRLHGVHTVNLALRLTLLDLLLRPIGDWFFRPAILGLAALGVMLPSQLRRPLLWIVLAILTLLRVILNWPMADNHAYLLSYWCLAVACALVSRDPPACLALNGRLLIGLAFACATLWKVFRVLLLTDRRFESFAQVAGGLTPELLESLRAFVTQHVHGPLFAASDAPQEPTRFLWLTYLMTWWTVLLESAVAVTFLWPCERGMAQWRNATLLLFCATIYAVAPVEGFGWLLIAMGVAQCDPARRKTCLLYLVVFLLIIFYRDAQWVEQLLEFSQHREVQR
jgi:hypothetical protein